MQLPLGIRLQTLAALDVWRAYGAATSGASMPCSCCRSLCRRSSSITRSRSSSSLRSTVSDRPICTAQEGQLCYALHANARQSAVPHLLPTGSYLERLCSTGAADTAANEQSISGKPTGGCHQRQFA